MQESMTKLAAEITFTAPFGVRVTDYISTIVCFDIVDKKLEGFALVSFNEIV